MGLLTTDRNQLQFVPVETCGYPCIFTVFPTSFPIGPDGALRVSSRLDSILVRSVMPKKTNNPGQIVLFPTQPSDPVRTHGSVRMGLTTQGTAVARAPMDLDIVSQAEPCQVVLSGSYRKDFDKLRATYEELLDLGCQVLSPSNVIAVQEIDGFVFMKGEEAQSPDLIEGRHLDAIQKANFVWLHAPEGYIGPTASLEIGFARAIGVPVFAKEPVKDAVISSFVEVTASPEAAIRTIRSHHSPIPRPALVAFQHYYRRVAIQRGYKSESPKDCLLLMVEEVGELARETRRRDRLVRHGPPSESSESKELADIFLYVVHMANVLDIDLSKVVQEKELVNLQRFLHR